MLGKRDARGSRTADRPAPGRIAAVVLAAGRAERMGECKPLLPLGRRSALEQVVFRLREGGVSSIRVVFGAWLEAGLEAERLKCRAVENPDYDLGMFSSVQAGLRSLPKGVEAVLIQPADIPLFRSRTVRSLLKAFRRDGGALVPSFLGRTGHPLLLPASLIPEILSYGGDGGLREFLRRSGAAVRRVSVADEGILRDMDHPEDYRALRDYEARGGIPTRAECLALLALAGTPEPVARHARRVASVSLEIGRALAPLRRVNLSLLEAAALLHDLAKGRKRHEAVAARALRRWGFPSVAKVVATHTDLPKKAGLEQRILYLADKLTNGERLESLDSREDRMLRRFSDEEARKGARRRIGRARRIRARFERILGGPLPLPAEEPFGDRG